jgi:hypothetical protein
MPRLPRLLAATLVATGVILLGACSSASPTGPTPLCAKKGVSTTAPSCASNDFINPKV